MDNWTYEPRFVSQEKKRIAGWIIRDGSGEYVCEVRDERQAALIVSAGYLLKAVKLVLAIEDHPEQQSHPIKLDPMARRQLEQAVKQAESV